MKTYINEVAPEQYETMQIWRFSGNHQVQTSTNITNNQWMFDYYSFEQSLWRIQSDIGTNIEKANKRQIESLLDHIPKPMNKENWARLEYLISKNHQEEKAKIFFETLKKYRIYQDELAKINSQYREQSNQEPILRLIHLQQQDTLSLQNKIFDKKSIKILFHNSNQSKP